MKHLKNILFTLLIIAVMAAPIIVIAASTHTNKLGLEMPEQGDVGWDDAFRINHKIYEVIAGAQIDGHLVKSGCTPTDGGGLIVSWAAGTVKFAGVEYSLDSGSTTLENNDTNWLSAVTIEGLSGATVRLRSTEYDIPSAASGYYTPLAIAITAAGSIERLKDIRYIPKTPYSMDQDMESGDDVEFNKVYVVDQTDSDNVNARSGLTMPHTTDPSLTADGQVGIDSNDLLLKGRSGDTDYGIPLEDTIVIIISSPDLLDDPGQQPLWTNGGATFYLTAVTFYAKDSGVSIEGIVYSDSETNYQFGAGVTIFNFVDISTAGTSVYRTAQSGVTPIPPYRTVLMDYGVAATDWIKIVLVGKYIGAKP